MHILAQVYVDNGRSSGGRIHDARSEISTQDERSSRRHRLIGLHSFGAGTDGRVFVWTVQHHWLLFRNG